MLKKNITYTDFNGFEKTEEFLFNFSDAELVQMEMGVEGGSLSDKLKSVQRSQDGRFIMDVFRDLILKSVGERSADGALFHKRNGAVAENFEACGAFSVLFIEIVGDPDKARDFTNGLVSAEALNKAREAAEQQKQQEGMTQSEIARANSEASLQGYKTAEPKVVSNPEPQPAQVPSMSLSDREELERLRAQFAANESSNAQELVQQPYEFQAPITPTVPQRNEGTHFNPGQ